MELEATGVLTQDAEPGGTTLVDARNGFNDLIRLAMLWTVRHRWPAGSMFAFNCYSNWRNFSSASLVTHRPFS